MEEIYKYFDIVTLFVSGFWLYANIKNILSKPRYVVYALFVVFYVFPLLLDYTLGLPEYDGVMYLGFDLSSNDALTRVVYDVSLLLFQYFLLHNFAKDRETVRMNDEFNIKKQWLYFGMLIAPFITVVLDHDFFILYTIQWREIGLYPIPSYYYLSEPSTYIGLSCSLFLLSFHSGKKFYDYIFSLALLYVNICIEGKRAILMFLLVNISIILLLKYTRNKDSKGKRSKFKALSIFIVLFFFGLYMVSVSTMVMAGRGFDENDTKKMEMLTRVDFLRDDRGRMALYSELHPDKMKILTEKGQTLYYDLIYTFPINLVVHNKNAGSYQEYFTSALRGESFSKSNNYMTTSIWAELISNFGIIIGCIFMYLLTLNFGRLVETYNQQAVSALLLSGYVLINMFTFAYVIMYIEYIFAICYLVNKRKTANS